MQSKINQVNTLAHKVKRKLEVLDKDNEAAKQVQGSMGDRGIRLH